MSSAEVPRTALKKQSVDGARPDRKSIVAHRSKEMQRLSLQASADVKPADVKPADVKPTDLASRAQAERKEAKVLEMFKVDPAVEKSFDSLMDKLKVAAANEQSFKALMAKFAAATVFKPALPFNQIIFTTPGFKLSLPLDQHGDAFSDVDFLDLIDDTLDNRYLLADLITADGYEVLEDQPLDDNIKMVASHAATGTNIIKRGKNGFSVLYVEDEKVLEAYKMIDKRAVTLKVKYEDGEEGVAQLDEVHPYPFYMAEADAKEGYYQLKAMGAHDADWVEYKD